MRPIGMDTWVWASPLTDATIDPLLDHVAALGFDAVELPWRAWATSRSTPWGSGLGAPASRRTSCGPWPPAGTWWTPTRATDEPTPDYLRACIDLAAGTGAPAVCGPFYASTGRVWRLDAEGAASRHTPSGAPGSHRWSTMPASAGS